MIQSDVKAATTAAMKERDTVKLDTLRGLSAAFTNELVATGRKPTDELPDEDAIAVIRREVKKRKEAAEAFEKAGRTESAEKERQEQALLEAYLPAQISIDAVQKVVEAKKQELGVSDKKDMGRLMGAVMAELKGKADGGVVKKVVDSVFE
ncbi:MAG: GatB/YqeY domain-containing protein [Candidatus Paceibacteria bacterium]